MDRCTASVDLDFDPVSCDLEAGHPGLHEMYGDGGRIRWEQIPQGSR